MTKTKRATVCYSAFDHSMFPWRNKCHQLHSKCTTPPPSSAENVRITLLLLWFNHSELSTDSLQVIVAGINKLLLCFSSIAVQFYRELFSVTLVLNFVRWLPTCQCRCPRLFQSRICIVPSQNNNPCISNLNVRVIE